VRRKLPQSDSIEEGPKKALYMVVMGRDVHDCRSVSLFA